jgi:mRNA interferase HicA
MKRRAFLQHLTAKDCELVREGGNHSWWRNRSSNKRSAVPRHQEVNDLLVKKICKDLGIAAP